MNKNNHYKINKYKLKLLHSIKHENKCLNKSNLYLKKYLNYFNNSNGLNQIGGTPIKINTEKDFENFILNISKLLNTIFGDVLGKKIIDEFKSTINVKTIKYPNELDLDIIIKKILELIFFDSKNKKYHNNEFEKQINDIIEDTLKAIKSDQEKTINQEEKQIKQENQEEKQIKQENQEKNNIKSNNNIYHNPFMLPILYSPMIFPTNYSFEKIKNNSISSESESSTDSSSSTELNVLNKNSTKKYKNKFNKNIIIY